MGNPTAHTGRQNTPAHGEWLHVETGYEDLLAHAGLDSIESIFSYADGESLNKPGLATWRERIRITVADGGETRTLYLKRFTQPPAKARREARHCGNGARSVAGVEWNWLHIFRAAGIPCAAPVALAEEMVSGRERRSAVIMAAVPGRSLEAFAADWTMADRRIIADVIVPTAQITARMHALGCVHRDLYLSHWFVEFGGPVETSAAKKIGHSSSDKERHTTAPVAYARGSDGSNEVVGHPTVHLIDLQRVFRPRCCMGRWVVKDLASLHFSAKNLLPPGILSRADALRWLKKYLNDSKLDAPAKQLAYRVIGRTQSMLRRQNNRRKTA